MTKWATQSIALFNISAIGGTQGIPGGSKDRTDGHPGISEPLRLLPDSEPEQTQMVIQNQVIFD